MADSKVSAYTAGTDLVSADLSGIQAGVNKKFPISLFDTRFVTPAGSQTLTNKTLTSPVLNTATAGTSFSLSATGDTNKLGFLSALAPDLATDARYVSFVVGKSATSTEAAQYGYYYDTTSGDRGAYMCVYGNSELTNSVFVRNGGNVGIGTSTPSSKLEVSGTMNATTVQQAGVAITPIGRQTLQINADMWVPQVTTGCGISVTEVATSLVPLITADFDQSTGEFAHYLWVPPKKWDRGAVSFDYVWTATSGSGSVVLQFAAHAVSNDDPLTFTWASSSTATDTLIATSDMHRSPESSTFTPGGTPAAGDLIYLRLFRDVSNGSDTLTGDLKVMAVNMYYNTTLGTDV